MGLGALDCSNLIASRARGGVARDVTVTGRIVYALKEDYFGGI